MSNIYRSISKKLTALNVDIYHYEDIVRCYILAKLNIEHSKRPNYTDGIHTEEFASEAFRYQLLSPNTKPYYDSSTFFSLCSELASAGIDKDCRLFFKALAPFLVADWDRLVSIFPKGQHERILYVLYLILKSTNNPSCRFRRLTHPRLKASMIQTANFIFPLKLRRTLSLVVGKPCITPACRS